MNPDVIPIISALAGAVPGILSAWIVYRRSSNKLKLQADESAAKLAAARAEIEAKRLAAQAEYERQVSEAQANFKQKMDESEQQNKLIDAIIEQGRGAKDLAESVRTIASSIRDNTQATNELKESVEKGTRKTTKLDESVEDFAARLVKATSSMEKSNEDVQRAKDAIEATSQRTQANSTKLAMTILEEIAVLKNLVTETRSIVDESRAIARDIDERVKRLEARPEASPPVNINLPPAAVVKTATAPGLAHPGQAEVQGLESTQIQSEPKGTP